MRKNSSKQVLVQKTIMRLGCLKRYRGLTGKLFYAPHFGSSVPASCNNELLTCVYSYVPDKLTGLLESLSAVLAAVCEAAAVDVLLVIPGTGRQRPAREETHTKVIHARNVQHVSTWHSAGISLVILTCFSFSFLNILQLSTHEIRYETLLCRCTSLVPGS